MHDCEREREREREREHKDKVEDSFSLFVSEQFKINGHAQVHNHINNTDHITRPKTLKVHIISQLLFLKYINIKNELNKTLPNLSIQDC